MVLFKNMKSDPDNRSVRQIIEAPTGIIKVFEPSQDDVKKMMKLQDLLVSMNQDVEGSENEGQVLEVSGLTIIRELIPMLTDIEFDEDMSDEEIEDIIENPNMALMEVSQVLSSIVTSVYKMMILSAANHLLENDMMLETYKVDNAAMNKAVQLAAQTDDGLAMINEIQQKELDLEAAEKAEEESAEVVDLESYRKGQEDSPTEDVAEDYQDKVYQEKVLAHYEDLMD